MSEKNDRIAIAGASTLVGKELAEDLQESLFAAADTTLLDEGDAEGKLETVADEVTFIQRIDAAAFTGVDFAFFSGSPALTRQHFPAARQAGASVVDLSYALEDEEGVLVRSPWIQEKQGTGPDLKTPAVVSAHPAAIMIALVATRLQADLPLKALAATVLQPASEGGRPAMDELHQQTVNLLSFQNLPREQFDAQSAFNLLSALGPDSRLALTATAARIRRHCLLLAPNRLPSLALQILQAPVFHGFAISLLVDLDTTATVQDLETAVACDQIDVMLDDADPPNNLNAAGQSEILARISPEVPGTSKGTRFWVWMSADNLKLAALNAIACAAELKKLRPTGKVQ